MQLLTYLHPSLLLENSFVAVKSVLVAARDRKQASLPFEYFAGIDKNFSK